MAADFENKNSFGSDNHSGVHPQILEAVVKANVSHAPSYGTDALSGALSVKVKSLFGSSAEPFLVFNGTAANTLALKAILKPWQSVICSDISHLNLDECAAPESIAGLKLIPARSNAHGKLTPDALKAHLVRFGDQHFAQPGALSVTQPTELGTLYTLEELRALAQMARAHNLKLHIDGARLSNAVFKLDISFRTLLEEFPADALSFGGTKNGLLGAEMVILWNKELVQDFKYIRKQNMLLPSNTRFLAVQMLTYLEDDLYLQIAEHSCLMASRLAEDLRAFRSLQILHPVESNAVFTQFPKAWTATLRDSLFFYIWETDPWTARLMTSFDTSDSDRSQFIETVRRLENKALGEA